MTSNLTIAAGTVSSDLSSDNPRIQIRYGLKNEIFFDYDIDKLMYDICLIKVNNLTLIMSNQVSQTSSEMSFIYQDNGAFRIRRLRKTYCYPETNARHSCRNAGHHFRMGSDNSELVCLHQGFDLTNLFSHISI